MTREIQRAFVESVKRICELSIENPSSIPSLSAQVGIDFAALAEWGNYTFSHSFVGDEEGEHCIRCGYRPGDKVLCPTALQGWVQRRFR